MIRILYCPRERACQMDMTPEDLPEALRNRAGLLWVDIAGEETAQCEPILRKTFGFHPLAVEDALSEAHVPKLDEWDDYIYLVLHDIVHHAGDYGHTQLPELDIFLGHNYIVTHHQMIIPALERTWVLFSRDERLRQGGPDHILFRLSHELVKDHLDVIAQVEEVVNELEDRVFDKPSPDIPEKLFDLKRMLLQMRRTVGPQREVFNKLARDKLPGVDSRDKVFFRDVHDQAVRLYDLMESQRDLVTGTLDTYLSMVNNRMNETMRLLTVITTLFMPLAFVTGFFGMNFFQPVLQSEWWTGAYSLEASLGIMVLVPFLMFWWMKRKGLV
ncbi:MAG: magnesium/cobalt transporter CorA [Anaerolineales bacterium]|nr:magnesium/cobalt transporter CorA [Anaerolineales bacterium]